MNTDTVFGIDPEALGLVRGNYQGRQEIHVCCPFHGGTGSSASFNITTGRFYCFKCGEKATAMELARMLGGQIITKIIKKKKDVDPSWRYNLSAPIDVDNKYLLSRGVTPEQIECHEIRSLAEGIGVPLKDYNGEAKGIVIRRYKGRQRYNYGGERLCCWPMNRIRFFARREPLLLVEGIFGALRAEKYGFNAIASLGATIKPELIENVLSQFGHVIAIFDNDLAGYKGYTKLLKVLPTVRVLVPGVEVDEANEEKMNYLVDRATKTNDVAFVNGFVERCKLR